MQFLKRKTLLSPQIFNIVENSDASRQIGYYSLINSLTYSCIHLFKAFIKAGGHVDCNGRENTCIGVSFSSKSLFKYSDYNISLIQASTQYIISNTNLLFL